jgi:hypothetical protein
MLPPAVPEVLPITEGAANDPAGFDISAVNVFPGEKLPLTK